MFYSNEDIDNMIDEEIYNNTHQQVTINASRKLYLKQTWNVITIERDWVIEYRQEYAEGWVYKSVKDAFRVMRLHHQPLWMVW